MPLSPNWVGLATFGLLGVLNPGFWLIGAGLELAYLYVTATNPRFQRAVNMMFSGQTRRDWGAKAGQLISELAPEDQRRYRALEERCRLILAQATADGPAAMGAQSDGLRRLLWIYLRLLVTRQTIAKVLKESGGDTAALDRRVADIDERLKSDKIGEELRKSLSSQAEILKQRIAKQQEAREKLTFLEAELTRIQEQAELIREQGALNADPEALSQRIDQVSETLGGTMQWIQEQQKVYGNVEDILAEPPPLSVKAPTKESQ